MALLREATLATAAQRWCDVTGSPSVCCRMGNAVFGGVAKLLSNHSRDRHVAVTTCSPTCALLCPWDCNLITCVHTCVLPSRCSGSSAAKGIHHILWNQNVHHRLHNSPLPILCSPRPVMPIRMCFCTTLDSTSGSDGFFACFIACVSYMPHALPISPSLI